MRMRFVALMILVLSICATPLGFAQSEQSPADGGRKVIRRVDPQYPPVARKMNLGGTVKVIALVGPDGSVRKVEPVGGSPLLVQAAENAVSLWRFAPGAESKETVELHFTP